MSRPLSEQTIHHRMIIKYHQAQALGRNLEYQEDIRAVQRLGIRFGHDGFADPFSYTPHITTVVDICRRAGLLCLILPQHLRRLTVEDLLGYNERPLFYDLPGYALVLTEAGIHASVLKPWLRSGDVQRPLLSRRRMRDLVRVVPIPMRRLSKHHQEALYPKYWEVYDMRRAGIPERVILETLWPFELYSRDQSRRDRASYFRQTQTGCGGNFVEKDSLSQRVYDYEKRARALIQKVYSRIETV